VAAMPILPTALAGAQGNQDKSTFCLRPETIVMHLKPTGAVLAYDREGRLVSMTRGGRCYWRGLDNRIMEKAHMQAGKGPTRVHRILTSDEARSVLEEAYAEVRWAAQAREKGRLFLLQGPGLAKPRPGEIDEAFTRSLSFTPTRLVEQATRFHLVYSPVPILPPDQYRSLVLQATLGCPYNRCNFCTLYRGVPYQVRTPDGFRDHIRAVKAFLGAGISRYRAVFLGDANAIAAPQARLLELLEVLAAELPYDPDNPFAGFQRLFSFMDMFLGVDKSPEDLLELRHRGLCRVYVGLETGHDRLLEFLEKPGTAADAVEVVRRLKGAGIGVGIIVLLGIGGRQYGRVHVRDTINVLGQMPLDAGDFIFLSPLVEDRTASYSVVAQTTRVVPLSPDELKTQDAAIHTGIHSLGFRSTPRVAPYDIRDFLY
jgi:hypothetical protein